MKRLVFLIALVMLVMVLAKLPTSVISDTSVSLADSNVPDHEITIS